MQRVLQGFGRSIGRGERKSHFVFRPKAPTHFFFDRDPPCFHQIFERTQQSRPRNGLAQIAHPQRFCHQGAQYFAFGLIVTLVVGISFFSHGEKRLALQFQARGQGGFHHFAGKAHIILCHPAPKFDLRFEQKGAFVDEFLDGFDAIFVECGRIFAQSDHDARVALVLSQRHHHTRADGDAGLE